MSTTQRGLVYPDSAAAPDVPMDMQKLAQSIEERCFPYTVTLRVAEAYALASGSAYQDVTGMTSISTNDATSAVFDTSTPNKVVVKQAGLYDIDAVAGISADAAGGRGVRITVNGNPVVTDSGAGAADLSWNRYLGRNGYFLAVGAVVGLQAVQTSGADRSVMTNTFLSLSRRWSQ